MTLQSEHPSAFITYAQSNPGWDDAQTAAWREEVHAFAAVLRRYGVDAKIDLFSLHERGVDWTRFGPRAVTENDWVIAAVSTAWRDRYEGGNVPTQGAGAVAEADALISVFQNDQSEFRKKLVLVFLPSMKNERVPVGLHGVHRFQVDDFTQESLEDLLRLLTDQPRYPVPPLGRVPHFTATPATPTAISDLVPNAATPSVTTPTDATDSNGDPLREVDQQLGALRGALRRMRPPAAGASPEAAWYRVWQRLQEDLASLEAVRAELESDESVERPAPSDGEGAFGPHASAFEAEVIAAFATDGWEVERAGLRDVGFDFKARRGNETQVVEVKARRRLDSADVRRAVEYLVPAARNENAIPVLAVPHSSVTQQAFATLADTGVRLLQFRPE